MARILVQTNDRRTILDAPNVEVADINDGELAADLLDRLEHAIVLADDGANRHGRTLRRLSAIVPLSDYRDVGG